MKRRPIVVLHCLMLIAAAANAQAVYKCVSKGAVAYSHEPCVGATVVDTTPTQGLDKWTGPSRKGADVVRSEQNKAMADALRPLLNETPEQREKRQRRAKLSPKDRQECEDLDPAIAAGAVRPSPKAGTAPTPEDQQLFLQRKRYRELGC